jgi:hypothetical protein
VALVGQLDVQGPAILQIGQPLHEPGLLELVEPVRHRAAREAVPLCQLAGRAPVRRPLHCQLPQDAPLAVGELVVGERLFHLTVDELVDPLDPLDGTFDVEVDRGELRRPLLEQLVDPVRVDLLRCCHVRIVSEICLDVKLVLSYTLQVK